MTSLGALFLAALLAGAPMLALAQIPSAVTEAVPGLTPLGAGTYRWFGLKIYDAQLWTRGARPDFSEPLVLTLRYERPLKGAAIAERSIEEIGALSMGTPEKRRAWIHAMTRLFPDVVEGSTLAGLHLPGMGARFFHDGRLIGEIADPEFSRAFFSIWLDPGTSAPALRASLLGTR